MADDKSGIGITPEFMESIGLSRAHPICSETLEVWGARCRDDSFTASGVEYHEERCVYVYNDSGFFTLHVTRREKMAGRYDTCQICVLKDAAHLQRMIYNLTLDWRS